MSENDYVATAAAEKRLREVLEHRYREENEADNMAKILLAEAKIEYKARVKQVTITLDLPDTATPKPKAPEPVIEPEPEQEPASIGPRISQLTWHGDEPDYDDVHFD